MSPKTNRDILSRGKVYADRRAAKHGTQEVEFDPDARLEYLTGFHKRRVQRQKHAQEHAKAQERIIKLEERRKLREERKALFKEQLAAYRGALGLQELEPSSSRAAKSKKSNKKDDDSEVPEVISDVEEWQGFPDDVKPILKNIYEDASVVEVETLEPNENFSFIAEQNNVKLEDSAKVLSESITRAQKYAKFLGIRDESSKPKKKKFRYLTKGERKVNQIKANTNKRRR